MYELIEKSIERNKNLVKARINEFLELNKLGSNKWFSELSFCILTANYSAKGGIKIQEEMGDKFHILNENELASELKRLGHRFPNARANYIYQNQKYANNLKEILESTNNKREWLQKNIKGIGIKEASHFLRNTGHLNYAIVDKHILNILVENKEISEQKLNPKLYLRSEKILQKYADNFSITQGELDLYLWHTKTSEILK